MAMYPAYSFFQRLRSVFRLALVKVVYGPRVDFGHSIGVRRGFVVNIPVPGATLTIGDNCSFNNFCSLNVRKSITIGNNCIVGENVRFYDHDHVFNSSEIPIREQGFSCADIVVGDNCWIGSNVIVLKGVTIGEGSVIAAGVVIAKDVPPGSVVIARQSVQIRSRD